MKKVKLKVKKTTGKENPQTTGKENPEPEMRLVSEIRPGYLPRRDELARRGRIVEFDRAGVGFFTDGIPRTQLKPIKQKYTLLPTGGDIAMRNPKKLIGKK